MCLPQDPRARPQQSGAGNASVMVEEKGSGTLADTQKQIAAPPDHSPSDCFWRWRGPQKGRCLRRAEKENGFVRRLLLAVLLRFISSSKLLFFFSKRIISTSAEIENGATIKGFLRFGILRLLRHFVDVTPSLKPQHEEKRGGLKL